MDQCALPPKPTTTTTTTTTTTKPVYVRRDIAFDGQSFAVFPEDKFNWDNTLSDDFDAGEITIEIKLSTYSADGLILFQGSFSENFIALGGKTNPIAMVI